MFTLLSVLIIKRIIHSWGVSLIHTFFPYFSMILYIVFLVFLSPKLLISPSPVLNKWISINLFADWMGLSSSRSYICWRICGFTQNLYLGPNYIVYIWKQILHFVVSYSYVCLKFQQQFYKYFLSISHGQSTVLGDEYVSLLVN